MIPEYLFKQAEREANAAMMKELYTEGNMEPAVAGMDPESIDPEVAAAINTILGKLKTSDEPEEKHTVEKASSLRDCILKIADFDPDKDYGHLKADDIQVPETTWFENLANSTPVSDALDTYDSVSDFSGRVKNTVGELSDLAGMTYEGARDSLIEGVPNIKDYIPSISDIGELINNPESKNMLKPYIIGNELLYRFKKPFMYRNIEKDIKNPVQQDLMKAKLYADYLSRDAYLKGAYQTLKAEDSISNFIKNSPISKRIGNYIDYYSN